VAYPVVKKMFATGGILSQFVNFRNYNHDQPSDPKRSGIILSGVARQILNKAGVAIWWTEVPKSLPLPAVFIGVDVYHAPRKYDVKSKSAVSKASVAAVVIRIIRDHNTRSKMEYYTQTFKRASGQEYDLGKPIQQTLSNALKALKVPNPKSCIYWRDGVGDTAIANTSEQEIKGLRSAFGASVPIAMVVCQKRISTKFFSSNSSGGVGGMPAGTLVQACGDLNYPTYYINGTAPPYATPKPVRFLVAQRDPGLASTSLVDVTWGQMCDYPNWAGSIKVPVVCQLAHLLAEHAGNFDDAGESINHSKFANHLYFL
jgi:Piwi domain